jgi:hypothetical protein
MNPQLTSIVAQEHIADLYRAAERGRLARTEKARRRRVRFVFARPAKHLIRPAERAVEPAA